MINEITPGFDVAQYFDLILCMELLLALLTVIYIISLLVDIFDTDQQADLSGSGLSGSFSGVVRVEKRSLLNQQVARRTAMSKVLS